MGTATTDIQWQGPTIADFTEYAAGADSRQPTPLRQKAIELVNLSLRANLAYFVVLAVYLTTAFAVATLSDIPIKYGLYSKSWLLTPILGSIVFAWLSFHTLWKHRPQHPTAFLLRQIRVAWQLPEHIAIAIPVIIIHPIFTSLFTSLKTGISKLVPFYADAYLVRLDHALLGADAWSAFGIFTQYPIVVKCVDLCYALWFAIMILVLIYAAFSLSNLRLRAQYFVAFLLCWGLLGNFIATVFASVGPCFYDFFYDTSRFTGLSQQIDRVGEHYDLIVPEVQAMLTEALGAKGPVLGSGISAFPSLHVAIAALNAVYAWRFGWFWRTGSIAFLLVIQVGSIVLGWHYLMDGLFSLAAVPLIWWFAGHLARRLVPVEARGAVLNAAAPGLVVQ